MKGRPHIHVLTCQAGEPDAEVTAKELAFAPDSARFSNTKLWSDRAQVTTEYQAAKMQDQPILKP